MSSPNSRIAMLKEGRTYQALRPAHRQPYLDHCNSKLQLCNWHARQAMITNFRKTGYTNDEIEGVTDEFGETTPGIKSLAWEYLKSPSLEALEYNRHRLLNRLRIEDHHYLFTNWVLKEESVIACHTRHLSNLACFSTERCENFHKYSEQAMTVTPGERTVLSGLHQVIQDTTSSRQDEEDDDDELVIQEELEQLRKSMEPAPSPLPPSPPAQSPARAPISPPPASTLDLVDSLRRSMRHRSPSRKKREAMEAAATRPSKRGRR